MNERTVNYTIHLDGFKYHIKKGVLKKGSIISKNIHPLEEVEIFKEKIRLNSLVDCGDHYICKKNIKTGLLMAYNLHCGCLKTKLDYDKTITINGSEDSDLEIKNYFELPNIISADNKFKDIIYKDCVKTEKLITIQYNDSFLKNKRDGSFSEDEQFVVDALKAAGVIKNYRRGQADKQEADIIDIDSNRQIEIVSMLDDKIPSQFRARNSESGHYAMILEYINPESFVVSDGVIKKFTKRHYINRYPKDLAIYILGSGKDAVKKTEQLVKKIEKNSYNIINDFNNIYFIIHDPLIEESFTVVYNGKLETFHDSLCSTNIVKRSEIKNICDNEMYLLIEKNIFSGVESIYCLKGNELKTWAVSINNNY